MVNADHGYYSIFFEIHFHPNAYGDGNLELTKRVFRKIRAEFLAGSAARNAQEMVGICSSIRDERDTFTCSISFPNE